VGNINAVKKSIEYLLDHSRNVCPDSKAENAK
jgi:hypothetical protein